IEYKAGHRQQRHDLRLLDHLAVGETQLLHCGGYLLRFQRPEPDLAAAIGVDLDDLVLRSLPQAGVPATASLRQGVQAQNRRRLDADLLVGVDPTQRPALPHDLDLRPVEVRRLAEPEAPTAIPLE